MFGWQRLGETLLGDDDAAARWAYLKALRTLRLPAAWPSVYGLDDRMVRTLGRLFPGGDDGWERELRRFLADNVGDVCTTAELVFVEAVGVELARLLASRGERAMARTVLAGLLERAGGFALGAPCTEAALALAQLEVDLGHHDDAERRLRDLRRQGGQLAARAQLLLGRLVTIRQEPWAEEILSDALDRLERPAHRAEALVVLGERHLRQGDAARAEAAFLAALEQARAVRCAPQEAAALLGLGDLRRQDGEGADASAYYQQAREAAGAEPEVLQRVLVRRGDLYRMMGEDQKAAADYHRAAEAFAGLSLPIREGWARLRLAQLGVPDAAEAARALFKSADLSSGVAAVDAITGDPGASLGWHLARSAEHARSRANAQRARPPLTRADADRPERRLGAHRAAIAACQNTIVGDLSAALDQSVRALAARRTRLSDPNLAQYIAAVDLLSAHRSYEAAEALLRQLITVRPPGTAGRALVGALARSPNAALVDGLLVALEDGAEPASLASAAEVLGWRREQTAVPLLRRLAVPGSSPLLRRAAVMALGRIGDRDAVSDLLPALDEEDLSEAASIALLLLGEWRGLDDLAQALASSRAHPSRSHGEIVGRYGGSTYQLLLLRTSEQEGAAGLGALQGLGYLGDPRVVSRLIEATASRDPKRARVASGALEVLTGHHEPVEESLLRNRWLDWWEEHSGRFHEGHRYRHGQPMSPSLLITRMSHDDPLVRRSSYDELVISTGTRLPFDAEGPWRVQEAHLAAWRRWWTQQDAARLTGRWTFHGELIG